MSTTSNQAAAPATAAPTTSKKKNSKKAATASVRKEAPQQAAFAGYCARLAAKVDNLAVDPATVAEDMLQQLNRQTEVTAAGPDIAGNFSVEFRPFKWLRCPTEGDIRTRAELLQRCWDAARKQNPRRFPAISIVGVTSEGTYKVSPAEEQEEAAEELNELVKQLLTAAGKVADDTNAHPGKRLECASLIAALSQLKIG